MLQAVMLTVLVWLGIGIGVTLAGGLDADTDKTWRTVLPGWVDTTGVVVVGIGMVETGVGTVADGAIKVELTLVCLLECVLVAVWVAFARYLIFNSLSLSR